VLNSKFKLRRNGKNGAGFTLIELVVVIAIIALILAIAAVNYSSANKRTRDGRRLSDLQQIRSAAELYRVDNGSYPANTAAMASYLPVAPIDPLSGSNYAYYYAGGGATYQACALLEGGTAMCTANGGAAAACGAICGTAGDCNCKFVQP